MQYRHVAAIRVYLMQVPLALLMSSHLPNGLGGEEARQVQYLRSRYQSWVVYRGP